MLLELGVSRPSEVVLMSLGLSRSAMVTVAAYVTSDNWISEECLEWLRGQSVEGLDIPVLLQKEIVQLVESLAIASHGTTPKYARI